MAIVEVTPTSGGGGGSVATDAIWDAKGDLAAGTGPDAAVRVAAGADGLALLADSTQAAGLRWGAGGGGSGTGFGAVVGKSADETVTNSTALQNDDALLFALGASATEVWFVELYLLVTAGNVLMDFKAGFSVPAACTMLWGSLPGTGENNQPGFGTTLASQTPTALLTETGALSVGGLNGTFGVSIVGHVFGGGTAGNVNLQWAQATLDAGNLTVKRGSILRAMKILA